jgi:plasmid stabilization system protein ParE
MDHYASISEALAEGFWNELQGAFGNVVATPTAHHFDPSGLRRFNLKRFPYNILYVVKGDRIRIQVVRHNSRRPNFGVRRAKG